MTPNSRADSVEVSPPTEIPIAIERAEYPLIVMLCNEPRAGQFKHDAAPIGTARSLRIDIAAKLRRSIKRPLLVGNKPGHRNTSVSAP